MHLRKCFISVMIEVNHQLNVILYITKKGKY